MTNITKALAQNQKRIDAVNNSFSSFIAGNSQAQSPESSPEVMFYRAKKIEIQAEREQIILKLDQVLKAKEMIEAYKKSLSSTTNINFENNSPEKTAIDNTTIQKEVDMRKDVFNNYI